MATIDDVFNLLTAVNQTTLGRMEGTINNTKALLDAVNQTTLGRMEGEVLAIKQKVGA
jgi:hypothetical protein